MYRKYYPHIAELSEDEVAKQAPFGAKWRLLAQVEVRCYILISNISGSVKVAPLQILQFPVILPHKFQDAEKFNLQFSDFSEITETADKLRWLRYQKGLRQRDVADYAGIYRSTYIHYEEYGKDFYSPKHMEKIAQLFEVPVERLLDDYNLFLRNGQGKQIKAIRMKLGLTQREYADMIGISKRLLLIPVQHPKYSVRNPSEPLATCILTMRMSLKSSGNIAAAELSIRQPKSWTCAFLSMASRETRAAKKTAIRLFWEEGSLWNML